MTRLARRYHSPGAGVRWFRGGDEWRRTQRHGRATHHSLTPSELPLAVSKKCVWAGSSLAKTRSPAALT